MIGKRNAFRKWAVAATLVLLVALSGCRDKVVSVDTVADGSGVSLPVVTGLAKADELNKRLEEIFAPYAALAQHTVEASDGRLSVVYEIAKDEDYGLFNHTYDLTMSISDGRDALKITGVEMSSAKNITEEESGDLQWLEDEVLTECAIILKRTGWEPELTELEQQADEQYAVDTFVGLYEGIAEEELDISDVKVGGAMGETYQKALKLGILTAYGNYDQYEYVDSVYVTNVLNMACAVIDRAESNVYGRQSKFVTGQEFAAILRAVYHVCTVREIEGSSYQWSALGDVDFAGVAADMCDDPAYQFNRRDGAELVCRITNEGPVYSRSFGDHALTPVEDSDSIWVRRAMTHGFMEYYGGSSLFAPYAGFTVTNAIANAKRYINCRYNDWSYANNYEWDGYYTRRDVIVAAGRTAQYFDDRSETDKYNFEKKLVVNDRDYDWFYSQKNTGAYSSVNCMPSIATMAAHWYDQNSTVTVEDMRRTSTNVDGWTSTELHKGLDAYHVPYVVDYPDLDVFLNALDDGKILLVQYSDRPQYMTGHCYVIYGYRQYGDSLTFIINDSESLTYRAEIFGRLNGNGDEVDAQFSIWSIQNFVTDCTVVG